MKDVGGLTPPFGSIVPDRGWWPIREPYTGGWQQGMIQRTENAISYYAVYASVSLIASDIAKLRLRLMQKNTTTGILSETTSPSFSPVLQRPNHYQNRIKFFEHWVVSKLIHGNTYVLLQRDNRNVVTEMYVLDPRRTRPMVAPNGEVFYQIGADNLSNVEEATTVPASEIIHDVMVPLYHPLCGVSPLSACWLPAVQGLNIQTSSAAFFANGSKPGGLLTAPGFINNETAERLKAHWEQNYSGANAGRTAILGDGLKYEALSVNAVDAQLIEQLKLSAEVVASSFHVPAYMLGIGEYPKHDNIEALQQQYYSQCLQTLIESVELLLNEALGLQDLGYCTQFDLDDLLRMDTQRKVQSVRDAIGAGFMTPNEGRAMFDLQPVDGGDTPYMQVQNYSIAALAKRDAKEDPFAKAATPADSAPASDTPPPAPAKSYDPDEIDDLFAMAALAALEMQSQLAA